MRYFGIILGMCLVAGTAFAAAYQDGYNQNGIPIIRPQPGDQAVPFSFTWSGLVVAPPSGYIYTGSGYAFDVNTNQVVSWADCSTTLSGGQRLLIATGVSNDQRAAAQIGCMFDIVGIYGQPPHPPVYGCGLECYDWLPTY